MCPPQRAGSDDSTGAAPMTTDTTAMVPWENPKQLVQQALVMEDEDMDYRPHYYHHDVV